MRQRRRLVERDADRGSGACVHAPRAPGALGAAREFVPDAGSRATGRRPAFALRELLARAARGCGGRDREGVRRGLCCPAARPHEDEGRELEDDRAPTRRRRLHAEPQRSPDRGGWRVALDAVREEPGLLPRRGVSLSVTLVDVRAAAARLEGVAHRTPVFTSRTLDACAGAQIFLKAENLQRGGAFKFRGAYNAIALLPDEQRARGVVAYSSGNHAQAVALAASLLRTRAAILMPHDAPPTKLEATRGYGAEVVSYDRYEEDREQLGAELAAERGLALIPPFDHPDVVAGQGTAAL